MNLVFVCQSADASDPMHATTVRWIQTLRRRPEISHLTVLALHVGSVPAHPQLTVKTFRGRTRLATVWRFYAEVRKAVREGADAFFVYQGGPYPLLLWPVRTLQGVPVYYWKAHPHISLMTRLSATFAATKVFTSTPSGFPLTLPHLVIVGQGVDVERFVPQPGPPPTLDCVTVGRVTPAKRLEAMLHALARCRAEFGLAARLDIYGPTLSKDQTYHDDLTALADTLGVSEAVDFHGPVIQDELPRVLSAYRLFLNFSRTALDRTVVEAMACGVPVLSTNPAVAEILPPSLRGQLFVPDDDVGAQAAAIYRLLSLSERERADIGAGLGRLIASEHNLESLITRILREMDAHP